MAAPDLSLRVFIISLFISTNYLSGFYFCLPLNMKKRQIVVHILVSILWGYLLCINAYAMTLPAPYIIDMIVELGYMYGTIYLYSTGSVVRNIFVLFIAARGSNILSAALTFLVSKDFFMNFHVIKDGYKNLSYGSIFLFILCNTVCVLLIRKLIRMLPEEHFIWNIIYKIFVYGLVLQQSVEGISQAFSKPDYTTYKYQHALLQLSSGIFLILVILFAVIFTKTREKQENTAILEHKLNESKKLFQESIKQKQNFHTIRHEWNRQATLIQQANGYVPADKLSQYIENADEHLMQYMKYSQSGNLLVDTANMLGIKNLHEIDCKTELIIAPLSLDDDTDMELSYMLGETYTYITTNIKDLKWCRIYLRGIQGNIICSFETGYASKLQYLRCKLGTLIGEELSLNQKLAMTKQIIKKHHGSFYYQYDTEKITISYMLCTFCTNKNGANVLIEN